MIKIQGIPDAALTICRILREYAYEAYLVGGCVRDSLLSVKPNDWDITTNCLPEDALHIFELKGYKVIPTGLKHGTITVMVEKEAYEITTYRHDGTYSDGRHPDAVVFTTSLREDLARRDFTINAMAYDPLREDLRDPFQGQIDLKNKTIRAVGSATKRIQEDHLRMLRAVRYSARYGFRIDTDLHIAIQLNAYLINIISAERVLQELVKAAETRGEQFAWYINELDRTKLLSYILPEISRMHLFPHTPETHPEGDVYDHTLAAIRCNEGSDPNLNLALLFHDVGKPDAFTNVDKIRYISHHELGLKVIDKIAERLKMSNELKEKLEFVCKWHMVFHRLHEMSDHKLVNLIASPHWDLLYKAAYCDDMARGVALVDQRKWQLGAVRVHQLKESYAKMERQLGLRKSVNGEFVMSLTGLPQSRRVGEIIGETLEYIVNKKLDPINDHDQIRTFVLSKR